jgi:hypothetical protein
MLATDVYSVAKALSQEEYLKLFVLMKKDFSLKSTKKNKALDFTVEDAMNYLLENNFFKKRSNRL